MSTPTAPLPQSAVVRAVAQYETAALHAAELAAKAATGQDLRAMDVRSWEFAEELMAGARATLAEAGRLDLIVAGEHDRPQPKPPLPQRPRGPHPTRGAVA